MAIFVVVKWQIYAFTHLDFLTRGHSTDQLLDDHHTVSNTFLLAIPPFYPLPNTPWWS